MATVDFSSSYWQAQLSSASAWCGDASGCDGSVDPDTGAVIQMHAGVMKVVSVAARPALALLAHSCDESNPVGVPSVECWIALPHACSFARFRFERHGPGTVRVFFYASTDRSRLLRRQDEPYAAAGEARTVTYSDASGPVRLIVIEFTAPESELIRRVELRRATSTDASDATGDVVRQQLNATEPFTAGERKTAVVLNGSAPDLATRLMRSLESLRPITS